MKRAGLELKESAKLDREPPLTTKIRSIMSNEKREQEHALVTAAQKGDRKAYSSLVRLHQGYLRAFVASRTAYSQDVDDLAQDAFVTAFRKLPELEDSLVFRSWLSGIALNLIRNHQRKHQRMNAEEPDVIQQLLHEQQVEGRVIHTDANLSALSECLLKLEHDQKQVLRAHYAEGLSVKELCQRFSVKHSTMTMRLYRCREWLRQCILDKVSGEGL